MTDANGGGDVDPVEIMLNALADAEADVRSGLYERGKAFSRLAQAAALTAIAAKLLSDSAEGREILGDVAAKYALDRAKDGHYHIWLSDDRCATPRCRALKGASTVAESTP